MRRNKRKYFREINLLKSTICAEPKGRVAVVDSQKEEFQENGKASTQVPKHKRRGWRVQKTG